MIFQGFNPYLKRDKWVRQIQQYDDKPNNTLSRMDEVSHMLKISKDIKLFPKLLYDYYRNEDNVWKVI